MRRVSRSLASGSSWHTVSRESGSETGSVTAEFAIVLPAILVVLMIVLAALQVGGRQVRLQSATTDAARLYARGDASAAARVGTEIAGATVTFLQRGDLACARARAPAGSAVLAAVSLTAKSCVLDEQRAGGDEVREAGG